MEMKKEYKRTEIGIIPKDWEIRFLPEICLFRNGKTHEQFISNFGEFICVNSKFISSEGAVRKLTSENFCPAKVGDVLMVMSDLPNGKALAKTFLADREWYYAVNQRICALSPKDSVSSTYLYYTLNRNPYFLKFNDGVNQTNLSNDVFNKCPVLLPSTKTEQERIGNALSDADKLIKSLERLISKKHQIKTGVMDELLTGMKRLPGFRGKWAKKKLGDVLKICHGRSQYGVEDPSGDYPILATGGQIGWANKFLYDRPSVLIGRKGTIDKPQFMKTPFWTVDTLFYSKIYQPNNAKYLFYQFCLIPWRQHNEASGVPSLNASTIESIEILCPQAEEQEAIASIISDMDKEIIVLESKLSKAKQIKEGMMKELLFGKIRLPSHEGSND